MTRRSRSSVAHAVIAAAALRAAMAFAQPLPAGVDECLVRIEQQRAAALADADRDDAGAAGPPPLGDVCPELAAAIDDGAWGKALAAGSAASLTANAFQELTRLVTRYEQPVTGATGRPLSADSLDAALAALGLREPATRLGLWKRIQQWLDERLGAQNDGASRWIEDWLGNLSLPERVVRYLLIVLGLVLVVATAAVIVNELRIAGVLAGGALRKYSPRAAHDAGGEAGVRGFDDIARAPLARRPALLLLLVLDRLRTRARMPLRDSLTHRELVAAASDLSTEQSDALRAVAGAAERATFGGWRPEEREVDDIVARGRTLAASLAGERNAPP